MVAFTPAKKALMVCVTWILHESEAFMCKALKAETIVNYASALITQQMEASGSPDLLGRS